MHAIEQLDVLGIIDDNFVVECYDVLEDRCKKSNQHEKPRRHQELLQYVIFTQFNAIDVQERIEHPSDVEDSQEDELRSRVRIVEAEDEEIYTTNLPSPVNEFARRREGTQYLV